MLKKTLFLALSTILACVAQLPAQNATGTDTTAADGTTTPPKTNDTQVPNHFWQATLPGGHYMVSLDRITAVSRAKYVLDGAVIVDEVTVDTVGQALARFYFISPITDATSNTTLSGLAAHGRELIDKVAAHTGTEVQNMVVKKYPETTHAKCIEYRILSEEDLGALLGSVTTAWQTGKGRQFTSK